MRVGARVRYIREDDEQTKHTGYFPPVGTLGTVVKLDLRHEGKEQAFVHWDSGTKGDHIWWCYCADLEVVEEKTPKMFVIMYGDYPKAIVETEADAQELVVDLNQEFAYEQFNWIMQSAHATLKRAMALTEFNQYWYKKIPKI